MGEKYLGQLTAKSAPATGDIMVLEDSEDTKKIDYDALANAILNKLTTKTYTVAGGTNTLIAAIDALNSNLVSIPNPSNERLRYRADTDCNLLIDEWALGSGSNYPPGGLFWYIHSIAYITNTDGTIKTGKQIAYGYSVSNVTFERVCNNGTWSAWVKQPERDEIETLNSKTNGALLWSGSTTLDGGTITLSSPVTNFTWLLFVFKTNNEIATCYMKADHATTEHPYVTIQAGEWMTDANRFQYCAWSSLTKTSNTTYDVVCKYNNPNFICKPSAVWGF